MIKRISRRQFVAGLGVIAAKLGLSTLTGCTPSTGRAAEELEPRAYLPLITNEEGASAVIPTPTNTPSSAILPSFTPTPTPTPTMTPTSTPTATPTPTPRTPVPPPTGSRVVHVNDTTATYWNGETDYWNYIDQNTVDGMMERGILALTGASNTLEAWQTLIPNYQRGQAIAIKINLNNSGGCDDVDSQIDALIQPINSIVRGLIQMNVDPSDIWVYDAFRPIPNRILIGSQYSIRFFGCACCEPAGWSSSALDSYVSFHPPAPTPPPQTVKITDVLVEASYLINVPIMKKHVSPGVTLSFKNHFGSINHPEFLHEYVRLTGAYYSDDYSPFVDLYSNPHILGKTVLIVGDGLFAARFYHESPRYWATFGDQVPNSLFLSTDPVAVDCVMCDFLEAEYGIPENADDYLRLAAEASLGTYERGQPWGSGYADIDYIRLD